MRPSFQRRALATGVALFICIAFASVGVRLSAGGNDKRAWLFALEMAKIENWREAQFRWQKLERSDPDNPRLLNNLAVAAEALGQPEQAREFYARATALVPDDSRMENNRQRFDRFWRLVGSAEGAEIPEEPMPRDLDPDRDKKAPGKGKAVKVTVSLPVPPRLELDGDEKVLVASFLAADSGLIDIDRELARFVRSKMNKSQLDILPITPPPAVPEQTLEDLIANAEFWRYLGREYGADLIVSGAILYGRRDASGFVDVDRISETTGQKVRTTEFVEQEKFSYGLDVIFMDGSSGTLLFRDRLQRSAVFRGSQNDPIAAFFQLSESLAPDLMAIVKSRSREDPRLVFKN